MGRAISNLIVLVVLGVGAYALWQWKAASSGASDLARHVERSCIDEIRSRFDTTSVKANSVRESANGFAVRATATLARGNVARVTCLTSPNGTVLDITLHEY